MTIPSNNGYHELSDGNQSNEKTDEQRVDMENVLEALGVPGWYQSKQIILLTMCTTPIAFCMLSIVFTGYEPSHCCHVINESELLARHRLVNDTSAHVVYGRCAISLTSNRSGQEETIATTGCYGGYDYGNNNNNSNAHISMVTEWDLVCDKSELPPLVQTTFMLGGALGSVVFPPFTNRFGRKGVYILTIVGGILSELGISFASVIYQVQALKFFSGFFLYTMYTLHFVLCSEMAISRHRQTIGAILNMWYSVNNILMTGVAYFFRDSWRNIYLTTSLVAFVPLLLTFWVNETPEWLMSKDRHEQAEKILMKACKTNRKEVSEVRGIFRRCVERKMLSTSNDTLHKSSKDSIYALIYNRQLCIISIISIILSFSLTVAYYGLYLISSTLAFNRFDNFLLMSITEFPACAIYMVVLLRYGRKPGLLVFVVSGFLCISVSIILVVWNISDIALTVFVILSQGACQASSLIWNMYCTELYPTTLRVSGVGLCTFVKLIGAMCASFMLPLSEQAAWLPYAVMGVLYAFCCLALPLLPETRNRKLPTTVDDITNWDKEV